MSAFLAAVQALVEQQRVANRIALARFTREVFPASPLIGDGPAALWEHPNPETGQCELKRDLIEAITGEVRS